MHGQDGILYVLVGRIKLKNWQKIEMYLRMPHPKVFLCCQIHFS